MIRHYGVLDADGVKIATITADDALVASGWWPGYGAVLVDEGPMPADPPPPPPPRKPDTWGVIPPLKERMEKGDRLDRATGVVTKAPVEIVADPVIADPGPIRGGGQAVKP